jgi:hypothetical protein
MNTQTLYTNIFPQSQRSIYSANENIDLVLSLDGMKLVPGSLVIEGLCGVFADVLSSPQIPVTNEQIFFDCRTGYHAIIRDITTEFANNGIIETMSNYGRLVKSTTVASEYDDSLATESRLSVEGRCQTQGQTTGYIRGRTATDSFIPFSLKPQICINKASGPIAASATGQIRLRLRLASNVEFLYGPGITELSGFQVKELRCRYQVVPDDMKPMPIQMEIYNSYRGLVDSNNVNISTFVPALCDSVHISFIPQSSENTPSFNYLQLAVPPGKPPLGATSDDSNTEYGVSRLYYAVNDVDSAIVGFTLESREEIVVNGLRSFRQPSMKYNALIRHFKDSPSDCYLAGMAFGSLIDFSKNKFSLELQSECTSGSGVTGAHLIYCFFRCLSTINA